MVILPRWDCSYSPSIYRAPSSNPSSPEWGSDSNAIMLEGEALPSDNVGVTRGPIEMVYRVEL